MIPIESLLEYLSYATIILIISSLPLILYVPLSSILAPPSVMEEKPPAAEGFIQLPQPRYQSEVSLEEAILKRRSRREWSSKPLALTAVSQILWAAQGITDPSRGFRAAPSAGATYPLEIYVVVKSGGVENLEAGIYHYIPSHHMLKLVKKGDYSDELESAALGQRWVSSAPVNFVIMAAYERTTRIYGERGYRYVHIEVGHVGQNIYLQAVALDLGTVAVGAFYDQQVSEIIGVTNLHPLYIMPVGHPGG